MDRDLYVCPMCQRKHRKDHMTWHHLLPTVGEAEKSEPSIYICKTCHLVVHDSHPNEELRTRYNTLELLLESPHIQRKLNLYKYRSDDCVFSLKRLKIYEKRGMTNDRREKRASKPRCL